MSLWPYVSKLSLGKPSLLSLFPRTPPNTSELFIQGRPPGLPYGLMVFWLQGIARQACAPFLFSPERHRTPQNFFNSGPVSGLPLWPYGLLSEKSQKWSLVIQSRVLELIGEGLPQSGFQPILRKRPEARSKLLKAGDYIRARIKNNNYMHRECKETILYFLKSPSKSFFDMSLK